LQKTPLPFPESPRRWWSERLIDRLPPLRVVLRDRAT
jgi:hypothetical protein